MNLGIVAIVTRWLEEHLRPCDSDDSATFDFRLLPFFEAGFIHPDAVAPIRMNVPLFI